ncbi:hypothetical protein LCGC14_1413070 [marine sediment metagenome]|uniref:Uncharacterized protein n=1 Tax=marine sediment metagenome TaxID=412755 RepID=A0A0F9M914_9ZZZZ
MLCYHLLTCASECAILIVEDKTITSSPFGPEQVGFTDGPSAQATSIDDEPGAQVVESGKADIEPDDYEEMLKARIPLSNNPRKASYLSYRAAGFSVRESGALAEVQFGTIKKWRRDDAEFRDWESGEKLAWLQSNVAHDLTQMEFMRNFRLCLRLDKKVLLKASLSLSLLTDREMEVLKVIRKHYTPQDIIAVQRALVPETDHMPPGSYRESITVTVAGPAVEGENAKRAAARELLENFEAGKRVLAETPELPEPNGEKPLEGEVL